MNNKQDKELVQLIQDVVDGRVQHRLKKLLFRYAIR